MAAFELAHYDAARRELELASRVDEVKVIRDKASAMKAYARMARDQELIKYSNELKERAEIRLGEILYEMKKRRERHEEGARRGGNPSPVALRWRKKREKRADGKGGPTVRSDGELPTLADLGVSKWQSSAWQRKAAKANGYPPPRPRRQSKAEYQRKRRDRQIGRDNLRGIFCMNAMMAIEVARKALKYTGPIDNDLLKLCNRASDAWAELKRKLKQKDEERGKDERRRKPQSATR
jgi:hypothetical protein